MIFNATVPAGNFKETVFDPASYVQSFTDKPPTRTEDGLPETKTFRLHPFPDLISASIPELTIAIVPLVPTSELNERQLPEI